MAGWIELSGVACCRFRAHSGAMGNNWRCGKCDGMDVLAHHRLCALRDPDDHVNRVVIVVWPRYGQPVDPWAADASPRSQG